MFLSASTEIVSPSFKKIFILLTLSFALIIAQNGLLELPPLLLQVVQVPIFAVCARIHTKLRIR